MEAGKQITKIFQSIYRNHHQNAIFCEKLEKSPKSHKILISEQKMGQPIQISF